MATGCMEIISSPYPLTSWNVPWIHVAFENAAAVASGVESGLKMFRRKGTSGQRRHRARDGRRRSVGRHRISSLVRNDGAWPQSHIRVRRQRGVHEHGSAAIVVDPVRRLHHDIAGRVTPSGQTTWKKDMTAIAAAHGIPYTATACPQLLHGLAQEGAKSKRGRSIYLHVLSAAATLPPLSSKACARPACGPCRTIPTDSGVRVFGRSSGATTARRWFAMAK